MPAAFAGRIGADAHRKAADYTIAHTRLGVVETIAGTLLLVALTLGRRHRVPDRLTGLPIGRRSSRTSS